MGVVLSRRAAGKVANLIRERESKTDGTGGRNPRKAGYWAATLIPGRTGGTAISAASGTTTKTYTSGSVTLCQDNGTALTSDGSTVTAYNRLAGSIPANTDVWLAWWGGKLWVVGYEC